LKKKSKVLLVILTCMCFTLTLTSFANLWTIETTPQSLTNYYLPIHPELNQTLNNPSPSHAGGAPIAIADIGDDGVTEVIIGSDNGWLYIYNCVNNNYTLVWNASILALNPNLSPGQEKIYSLAVGEIDTNTITLEILIGSVGHITILEWNGATIDYQRDVHLYLDSKIVTSIIVDDINTDGINEIIFATGDGDFVSNIAHNGELYVFNAIQFRDNPGDWSRVSTKVRNIVKNNWYQSSVAYTAVVGDPDNDGNKEIIANLDSSVIIIDTSTYNVEWDSSSQYSTPQFEDNYGITAGDGDNDGKNELYLGTNNGQILILKSITSSNYDIRQTLLIDSATYVWGLKIDDPDQDFKNELIATTVQGNLTIFQYDTLISDYRLETPQIAKIGAQVGDFNHIGVKDVDNDGLVELIVGKSGPNSINGFIDSDTVSRLFIFGYIQVVSELITPANSPVITGKPVIITAQYNRTDTAQPEGILGIVDVKVINNETQSPWIGGINNFTDEGGGKYKINISTLGAVNGNYTLKVFMYKPGFEPGYVYINFTVTGTETTLVIWKGASNASGVWETTNESNPYIGDLTKSIVFNYTIASTGDPLQYGDVIASLKFLNGTIVPKKHQLPTENLFFSQGIEYRGVYIVRIDTTEMHVGDYILTINVRQEGYTPSEIDIIVHVVPNPTIIVPTERYISIFEGQPIQISAVFFDTFLEKSIINAQLNYTLENYTGTVEHLSFGVYQTIIPTENMTLENGEHTIILTGSAIDHENAVANITLSFNLKSEVNLQISNIPDSILIGEPLIIETSLTYPNGTILTGEDIVFTYWFDSTQYTQRITTNDEGVAVLTLIIPDGVETVQVAAQYQGSEYTKGVALTFATSNSGDTLIQVTSVVGIVISWLPYIGIGVVAIVGASLAYRQFKIIPARKRREAEIEKSVEIFKNLSNIKHILVIENKSGLVIYDQSYMELPLDSSLIGGFIQAVSSFGDEISEAERRYSEFDYQNFIILTSKGKLIRTALILAEKPTPSLRAKIILFTEIFEDKYGSKLKKWKGNKSVFNKAKEIVDDVFEFNLMLPQKLSPDADKIKDINELQKSLIKLSRELSKDQETFYINQLIKFATTLRKETQNEILDAVYKLVQQGVFIPVKQK